jgi:hypothetical protein
MMSPPVHSDVAGAPKLSDVMCMVAGTPEPWVVNVPANVEGHDISIPVPDGPCQVECPSLTMWIVGVEFPPVGDVTVVAEAVPVAIMRMLAIAASIPRTFVHFMISPYSLG